MFRLCYKIFRCTFLCILPFSSSLKFCNFLLYHHKDEKKAFADVYFARRKKERRIKIIPAHREQHFLSGCVSGVQFSRTVTANKACETVSRHNSVNSEMVRCEITITDKMIDRIRTLSGYFIAGRKHLLDKREDTVVVCASAAPTLYPFLFAPSGQFNFILRAPRATKAFIVKGSTVWRIYIADPHNTNSKGYISRIHFVSRFIPSMSNFAYAANIHSMFFFFQISNSRRCFRSYQDESHSQTFFYAKGFLAEEVFLSSTFL